MAKDNAKRFARQNAARLMTFAAINIGILAWHIALLYVFTAATDFTLWNIAWWTMFWIPQEWSYLALLRLRGTPTYDASGNVIDCSDLTDPAQLGYFSYAQDALWVTWASHFLVCTFGPWFGLLWMTIPFFVAYKAITVAILPMWEARRQQRDQAEYAAMAAMQQQSEAGQSGDLRSKLRKQREELRSGKKSSATTVARR